MRRMSVTRKPAFEPNKAEQMASRPSFDASRRASGADDDDGGARSDAGSGGADAAGGGGGEKKKKPAIWLHAWADPVRLLSLGVWNLNSPPRLTEYRIPIKWPNEWLCNFCRVFFLFLCALILPISALLLSHPMP